MYIYIYIFFFSFLKKKKQPVPRGDLLGLVGEVDAVLQGVERAGHLARQLRGLEVTCRRERRDAIGNGKRFWCWCV